MRIFAFYFNCPSPFKDEHLQFIYAASILRAQLYNLQPITDRARVAQLAAAFQSKPFQPKEGVRIAVTDAEAANQAEGGEPDGNAGLALLF